LVTERVRAICSPNPFGKKEPAPATYLRIFKKGDIVDIKGDGSVHKGMPHKYYHGKTGLVWSVTPRALGVLLNKPVGNKLVRKKIYVRIEHCRHSKSAAMFEARKKRIAAERIALKKSNTPVPRDYFKNKPEGPRKACMIKRPFVETITPVPYAGILG